MTPRGTLETRRLLGSGAGPSRDRMFIGSEGTLGVISRLDAIAVTSKIPCWRIGSFPLVFRCGACAARHRTGRPLSIELPHP
jgi:hypothetical protein